VTELVADIKGEPDDVTTEENAKKEEQQTEEQWESLQTPRKTNPT